MAVAVKGESDAHRMTKAIAEVINNRIYLFPKGLNLTVKTEEPLPNSRFIPDITFYLDNKIYAVMEVVNTHKTSKNKNLFLNNWNITALDLVVTDFVECRKYIPFYLWEADFKLFVEEILFGKHSGLLYYLSRQDVCRDVNIDGKMITLVRYDVLEVEQKYPNFNLIGYTEQGEAYHFYLSNNSEMTVQAKINTIRLSNEPVYFLKTNHEKWIDALNNRFNKFITL